MHVTVDGFGGDPQTLADEELVRSLLDRYPEAIGMTKIAEPYVYRYVGKKQEDWGVSGFVLIAESHISIHTFPEHRYIWVDVFSCKSFDAGIVIEDLRRRFGLSDVKTSTLERGMEYPHSVPASLPLADQERREVAANIS